MLFKVLKNPKNQALSLTKYPTDNVHDKIHYVLLK